MTATDGRREEILGAAIEVFADKGFHEAKISDIASRLGVGHGTVYRYFENKLDLFEQVITHALLKVAQIVMDEDPTAALDIDSFRAQLSRLATRMFNLFVIDEPALARLLLEQAPGADRSIVERVRVAFEIVADYTEAYLRNGVDRGFLSPDLQTPILAQLIDGMLFEGIRKLMHRADREDEAQRWIAAAVDMIVEGVAGQYGAPAPTA